MILASFFQRKVSVVEPLADGMDVVQLDGELRAAIARRDKRTASAVEAEDDLNRLARMDDNDDDVTARYRRAAKKAAELRALIERDDRAIKGLAADHAAAMAAHTVATERVEYARRATAYAAAAADLVAATDAADAANVAAVAAVEDVLAKFDTYRAAARDANVAAPGSFPVGIALSSHWCVPVLMARMGTSFELSVSVAAAAGRMRFGDVVKFLRKEDQP